MPHPQGLVERTDELRALATALRDAASTGRVILLEGPAGIGKSRLLDAVRGDASSFEVLSARGGILEQDIALSIARQLFERRVARAPADERQRLLDGAASGAAAVLGLDGGAATELGSALHSLYWLTVNLSEVRSLLICVDDIHWADSASLQCLVYLSRRIEGLPIMLVAAVRSGEVRTNEAAIAELASLAHVIRPAPLSPRGVDELVRRELGPAVSPELVDACREATGGNPFYLRELLASLEPAGEEVSIETVRRALPSTVARSILLRLGRMSEPARRLAAAAAIMGDGAALRHTAALAGITEGDARVAADALTAAAILADVHPIRFEHPIVGAAIENDSPPAERAHAHYRAAMLLRDDGEPDERIASHLLQSGPSGEGWVAETLSGAARQAIARGVPDVAERLLRRAVDERAPDARLAELLRELCATQLMIGAYHASSASAKRALKSATDPTTRARIRLDHAYTLVSIEGAPAALASLEQAMSEAAGADAELALQIEGELALQVTLAGFPHPVLDRIGRHRDLPGETHAQRFMLSILALRALQRDEPAATVRELALRSLGDGKLLAEGGVRTMAFYAATAALIFAEANDEAHSVLEAGMNASVRSGTVYGYAGVCWLRGLLRVRQGDLPSAEADERACRDNAVPTMVGIGAASLTMVLLEQGDRDGAYAELENAGLLSDDRPLYVWGPYARGMVRLERGQAAEALADFADVGRHVTHVGGFAAGLPWQAHMALAHHALGNHAEAEDAAAEQLERARRRGAPLNLAIALRACGRVSDGDRRMRHFEDAVDILHGVPARAEMARARFDLGVAFLRGGKRTHGREQLQLAFDAARACGARGLAKAAYDELAVSGARPRKLAFSGAESLTASERRVAEMAAEGMTNREIAQALFLTPKTVENHLGRAYGKLGVSSRRALRGALDTAQS